MGKCICSRGGLYLLLVGTLVFGQVTACFSEDKFSEPETIYTGSKAGLLDGAVDPYGNWHVVFAEWSSEETLTQIVWTYTTKYANATNILTIDQRFDYQDRSTSIWTGELVNGLSISVDTTGGIHIFETVYDRSGKQERIYHFTVPKLLTLIPGINDHGQKMIDGSALLVQQDSDATVRICEEQRDQK